MGACQSCIGSRRKEMHDEEEENRLLYEDGNGMQYGSFADAQMNGENDTIEAQRESEALQKVIAKASNNMVDIFEIAPPESATKGSTAPFAYAGQGARVARYQHLVSRLSVSAEDENGSTNFPAGIKVDWINDDDNLELQNSKAASAKALDKVDGPLVGTFADAAAAMR